MIDAIRRFFESELLPETRDRDAAGAEHAYQLAAAALLVEMGRADFQVRATEREAVTDALVRAFGLAPDEVDQLVRLAEQEADDATSLHQFTDLVNRHFEPAQKVHLVELLWRVAAADGRLDKYEDYLVRKVADLIYVSHTDFIRTKHRVLDEHGGM